MVISAVCWCLVALLLRSPQFSAGMSNAEGNALIEVKNLLIGRSNALSSWNPDLVSPCSSWTGVDCSPDGHVTSVSLAGLGLSGVLSGAIANLTKLQTLTLKNNMISGPLPDALGMLSALETFDAGKNSFNGSIPSSWGTLVKLKFLVLNNNHLTGGIPDSIVNLPSLLSLDLSFNNLTGQIPATAFKLQSFNFAGNNLPCGPTEPCQSSDSSGNTQKSTTKSDVGKVIGGLVGAVLLLSIVSFAIIRCERERRRLITDATFYDVPAENELKIAFGQLKRFSLRELQSATNNFSEHNVVGHGAFARVYKGILDDATEIGVKRLMNINLDGDEAGFLQEVELISVAVHRNLLRLIGFCVTPSERILVYPYMSNRSLAYCLRERKGGEPSLDWKARKKIALGAARGLEYLHDYCNPKIIHRDVKAANVLLDGDYEAVVGDFGLAKLVDTRNTHVTTMVRGTLGHIAPEYLTTGRSSEKTDVFGYGVMLLELVTGQRAIEMGRLEEENEVLLLDYVKALQYEKRLGALVDPNLKEYDGRELEQMVQVALLCTQMTAEERPTMGEVVRMLSGEGGLAERWEEWQQVELTRRREFESFPRHLLHLDDYSTSYDLEAIQLSSGR